MRVKHWERGQVEEHVIVGSSVGQRCALPLRSEWHVRTVLSSVVVGTSTDAYDRKCSRSRSPSPKRCTCLSAALACLYCLPGRLSIATAPVFMSLSCKSLNLLSTIAVCLSC